MIGQTLSHYRIIERLGGNMGVVYLAEDTQLGRKVAIKTLPDANGPGRQHLRARFRREAQLASKLSHPHIATVHDYGETAEGQPYIVMEFVKGETLEVLMTNETLTIPRALQIAAEVAGALAEAHSHGLIHRDIKPSNIVIDHRGEVKVLDFGLAKQIYLASNINSDSAQPALADTQTREGMIVGTPRYMSPEQALGVAVDPRSDLFSLSAVLYECIAGRPPFTGGSPVEIVAKIIRDDPLPPSQINPNVTEELNRIALKGLAKKPDDRYQSASDMIDDLESARADASSVNQKVTRTIKPAPKTNPTGTLATLSDILQRPRFSVGYVSLGVLVAALVALGVWVATRPKPHQPTAEAQRFYDLGEAAIREGAFYKASKLLQRSADADRNFALAHARLSETWTELDFTDKGQEHLIRAQELAPNRSALTELDSLRFQAIANTIKHDFAKAVEDYRRLVQIVPESEKKYAYVDLGRAYEKNEETTKSIECYREATKRDPDYAAAFLRLAVALRRSQKFLDAHAAFEKAYRGFDVSNELEGMTEVFYQRGILFSQQGKVREAKEEFQQALKKSVALENQDQGIKTLLQLSNISIVAGEPQQAQDFSQKAIELAQASGMENLTTAGLIDIGNSYFVLGKYTEAESNYDQALRLAISYKGRRNEARALLSLASLRTHQSKPDEAGQFAERALLFYQQGGYRKETSQAYAILGHAYDQLGNYDAAIKAFEDQLKLAEQVGDPQQIALSHEGLGVVLNHQQNYPAALAHFNEQYKIVSTLDNKLVVGYALMNRGTMLWQLGQYDDADRDLAAALLIADNPGDEPFTELLAWIRVSKAQLELSKRNLPVATSESRSAMKLAGSKFKAIAVHAGYTLGLAQSLSRQTGAGRRSCEGAVKLAKELPDPLPLSHAMLALAQTAITSGDSQKAMTTAQDAQKNFPRQNNLNRNGVPCYWLPSRARIRRRRVISQSRRRSPWVDLNRSGVVTITKRI